MKNEKGEWLEPEVGVDMSSDEGRLFKKEPAINVISKEEFESRVEKVFHLLWKTLAKSFGPYGAPTLIYNYPFSHVTKDGYTIMKNLSMDASETKVDQAISDMASDICGRLNYSVGDGTTSAVIATNSIYQRYREMKQKLANQFILPRDVIYKYNEIKEEIIKKLQDKVRPIRTSNMDDLRKNIHDVVYISSNADELITEYISDLYKELGTPAISCMLAPDGVTKKRLINGYKYDLTINDRLYINSDDNVMNLTNADIVIFATKITKSTYQNILKPLNEESRRRGRHLIVAAPSYDDNALQQVISVDLNNEYRKYHEVNMVLTSYRAMSAHARKLVNDFSVLMNTTVIDRSLESAIMDELATGKIINQIFKIDDRGISGIKDMAFVPHNGEMAPVTYTVGSDTLPEGSVGISENYPMIENYIDLGFVRSCSLGLKTSQFTDLIYDENRYNAIVKEATDDLAEKEKKYQKLGTFNLEVGQAQERLYALYLKMGIIEVGGDSELSQKLLKDAVDDAIKAASSAFAHGVVLGCNIDLIRTIHEIYTEDTEDEVKSCLLNILLEGFMDVCRTVIRNAFDDELISDNGEDKISEIRQKLSNFFTIRRKNIDEIFTSSEDLDDTIAECFAVDNKVTVHNVLVRYAMRVGMVFDVSTFTYSKDVINSSQTDEEILKATIDLMTLLITGNQMVVTMKHNFE